MICPKCKGKVTICDTVHVNDTNETYRKRKCLECDHRFFTVEFEVDDDEKFRELWYKHNRITKHHDNWVEKQRTMEASK